MYKQSPSRNQRSKGIKVKHVLQICLLLAVCFWLIYQVKHSHDKKKEFDEHDAKISLNSERKDQVAKLGRKDLHPRLEETVTKNDKQDEEVEEEEETTVEEEENKQEEKDDIKTEVKNVDDDEGRGGEEEEVDDHDQEKSDTETDREEEFIDDEKEHENSDEPELEDKDSEENNGQANDSALQEHDNEGGTTNTHEAREENYKADDASSAVTQNIQVTTTDNETGILGKSNEQADVTIVVSPNKLNNTDEINDGQNTSKRVEGAETANNGSYLSATTDKQSVSMPSNSSVTEQYKDIMTRNNSTEVRGESDLAQLTQNGTISEQNQVQTVVEGHGNIREDSKLQTLDPKPEVNSTVPISNHLDGFILTNETNLIVTDSNLMESHKLGGTESSVSELKSDMSIKAEVKSAETENNDVDEDINDDGAGGINESLNESDSEASNDMQLEAVDSSDSTTLEEKDIRTDLETLPEIQTEGSNSEDAAAE